MKKQQGFSLIELLIVVAIIAIIAAIAVPNLLTARMAANETSAISALRSIGSAISTYITFENANPNTFAQLTGTTTTAGSTGTKYLDERFDGASTTVSGAINGYTIGIAAAVPTPTSSVAIDQFGGALNYIVATPGASAGRWGFGIGADQVVRYDAAATNYSLPNGAVAGDPVGFIPTATAP